LRSRDNSRRCNDPSPAELAEKAIDYAEAKEAYFKALRAEVPELMNIATGREARPPELDTFAEAFAVAGEDQEKAADEQTAVLLTNLSSGASKRFPPGNRKIPNFCTGSLPPPIMGSSAPPFRFGVWEARCARPTF
jgi:hypothetical protein